MKKLEAEKRQKAAARARGVSGPPIKDKTAREARKALKKAAAADDAARA